MQAEVELTGMEFDDFRKGWFSVRTETGSEITIRFEDWSPEFKTSILRAVEGLLNERLSEIGGRVIVTRFAESDHDDWDEGE